MAKTSMLEGLLRSVKGGVELEIRVKPGSRQTLLVFEDGCLTFYTDEPPLRGRASSSLVKHLSRLLGVPQSGMLVVFGHTGRFKRVRVEAPFPPRCSPQPFSVFFVVPSGGSAPPRGPAGLIPWVHGRRSGPAARASHPPDAYQARRGSEHGSHRHAGPSVYKQTQTTLKTLMPRETVLEKLGGVVGDG